MLRLSAAMAARREVDFAGLRRRDAETLKTNLRSTNESQERDDFVTTWRSAVPEGAVLEDEPHRLASSSCGYGWYRLFDEESTATPCDSTASTACFSAACHRGHDARPGGRAVRPARGRVRRTHTRDVVLGEDAGTRDYPITARRGRPTPSPSTRGRVEPPRTSTATCRSLDELPLPRRRGHRPIRWTFFNPKLASGRPHRDRGVLRHCRPLAP